MDLFVADTPWKLFLWKFRVFRCKYIHKSLIEGEQLFCTKCNMVYFYNL